MREICGVAADDDVTFDLDTFEIEQTERPAGLTDAFARDPAKQQLWKSFGQIIGAELPPLGEVIEELADFLMPHAKATTA